MFAASLSNSANRNGSAPLHLRRVPKGACTHSRRAITRLVEWLDRQRVRAELALGRPLQLAVCYEVGYDGFWLARILLKVGIRTVVFDPASFLKPRRGRWAKTDRLDAEEMTR